MDIMVIMITIKNIGAGIVKWMKIATAQEASSTKELVVKINNRQRRSYYGM